MSWFDLGASCRHDEGPGAEPSPGSAGARPRGPERRTGHALGPPSAAPPAVRLTMGAFPEAARLKNDSGLPWAAVVTPWTRCLWRNDVNCDVMSDIEVMRHSRRTREVSADDIARCRECGGFINSTCIVQRLRWQCSLCAEWNPLEGALRKRRWPRRRRERHAPGASSIVG